MGPVEPFTKDPLVVVVLLGGDCLSKDLHIPWEKKVQR